MPLSLKTRSTNPADRTQAMQNPMVTFIVPCYGLGHLLGECVESILNQTYGNFEILIMDDCSPDDTPAVARSFTDARVKHIRNEPNLGHLRNYNKGIDLSRGKYVWLISADDYLRRTHVLQKYVDVMEQYPRVGYAFCSGVGVKDGIEGEVLEHTRWDAKDRVISGRSWLRRILRGNIILSASGLVRRDCYEQYGAFPLDMPWAGDWYLWCLFALYTDVAYFEEPMVCYRDHGLSMTNRLTRTKALACCEEEVAIQWEIKRRADEAGFSEISDECLLAAANFYAKSIASKRFGLPAVVMTVEQFEESLCRHTSDQEERKRLRATVFAGMANEYYWQGDRQSAVRLYDSALAIRPLTLSTVIKRVLLSLGSTGDLCRSSLRFLVSETRR